MSRRNAPYATGGAFSILAHFMSEPGSQERIDANTAGGGGNTAEPPVVPGLAELIEILSAMAAAPLGARPKLNPDTITKIRDSPLGPVLKELQHIHKKLGPLEGSPEHLQAQAAQRQEAHPPAQQPASTPWSGLSSAHQPTPAAAAPGPTGIASAEAGLRLVSSKLISVSQAVMDMKDSTKAAKAHIETVEEKVSQISGRLDPALAELTQEVKRMQLDLAEGFTAERTKLETKVRGLEAEVEELEEEAKKLRKENKELQQVIRDTRAELSPVEVASKIALQGKFSEEPKKMGGPKGPTSNAPGSLVQTAKKVRANTLGLITRCRALLAAISRDPETDSNISDIGMEGEWGRCVEYLHRSDSKLRDAVEEKEETAQKLQFVGLVLDQMRKGHSIQLLAQDISRLTAQPAAASNEPASSAAPASSKP